MSPLTVMRSCVTLAWYVYNHAFCDTCGNLNFHNIFAFYDSGTAAVVALVLDDLALTVTFRTLGLGLHDAKHGAYGLHDNPRTTALRTCLGAASSLGAASVTVWTCDVFFDFELLCSASGYFLE